MGWGFMMVGGYGVAAHNRFTPIQEILPMELFDYGHRVECPSKFTPRLTWEGGARHEITKGRTLTCYEHVRSELESSAGVFSPEQAARDGHVVTAQNLGSHPEFCCDILACLSGSL